uniref:Uncharacterized protein n=1 Tax=Kalanchoe fedtschenkoi TaxID=63787 RepID=A0A7N1A8A9_KALFE
MGIISFTPLLRELEVFFLNFSEAAVFCSVHRAVCRSFILSVCETQSIFFFPLRNKYNSSDIVVVKLSILWQIPQYFLVGAGEIFTSIGQLEFFYEQSPDAMRSLCSALSLLTTSLGNYLSSLILTILTYSYFTTRNGSLGWIPDDLNEGHLDYFFWLMTGLSTANLVLHLLCQKLQVT